MRAMRSKATGVCSCRCRVRLLYSALLCSFQPSDAVRCGTQADANGRATLQSSPLPLALSSLLPSSPPPLLPSSSPPLLLSSPPPRLPSSPSLLLPASPPRPLVLLLPTCCGRVWCWCFQKIQLTRPRPARGQQPDGRCFHEGVISTWPTSRVRLLGSARDVRHVYRRDYCLDDDQAPVLPRHDGLAQRVWCR